MAQGTKVIWSNQAFELLLEIATYLAEHMGSAKASPFQQDLVTAKEQLRHFDEFILVSVFYKKSLHSNATELFFRGK